MRKRTREGRREGERVLINLECDQRPQDEIFEGEKNEKGERKKDGCLFK
jgi:hypothetical protein